MYKYKFVYHCIISICRSYRKILPHKARLLYTGTTLFIFLFTILPIWHFQLLVVKNCISGLDIQQFTALLPDPDV